MMKKNKGMTLVVLVITIVVMLIIASTVITISLDRFKMNDTKKMINDIELLKDAVANFNLKYGELPILEEYTFSSGFSTESGKYYIIDLSALQNISLNYGKDGFENPNQSDDVYIINESSRIIYYPKGVELGEEIYYCIDKTGTGTDTIPPTKPQINIISGMQNDTGLYITEVEIEILQGKDNGSGIAKTYYLINKKIDDTSNEETYAYDTSTDEILKLTENGIYTIKATSYDNANNSSEMVELSDIKVHVEHEWAEGLTIKKATCAEAGVKKSICIVCGATKTEEIPITDEHTWSDGTVTTKATCKTSGIKTYICKVCDKTKTESLGYGDHQMFRDYIPLWDAHNHRHQYKAYCTVCRYVEEEYSEWHVPPNNRIVCDSWQCVYCGDIVEEPLGLDDLDVIENMWAYGITKGAYESFEYFWKYRGYAEEDLYTGGKSGTDTSGGNTVS